jgi:hypothetical protein
VEVDGVGGEANGIVDKPEGNEAVALLLMHQWRRFQYLHQMMRIQIKYEEAVLKKSLKTPATFFN